MSDFALFFTEADKRHSDPDKYGVIFPGYKGDPADMIGQHVVAYSGNSRKGKGGYTPVTITRYIGKVTSPVGKTEHKFGHAFAPNGSAWPLIMKNEFIIQVQSGASKAKAERAAAVALLENRLRQMQYAERQEAETAEVIPF